MLSVPRYWGHIILRSLFTCSLNWLKIREQWVDVTSSKTFISSDHDQNGFYPSGQYILKFHGGRQWLFWQWWMCEEATKESWWIITGCCPSAGMNVSAIWFLSLDCSRCAIYFVLGKFVKMALMGEVWWKFFSFGWSTTNVLSYEKVAETFCHVLFLLGSPFPLSPYRLHLTNPL